MSNSRLNYRDRLFIRKDANGIAISQSALWRRKKPSEIGRWVDITQCVTNCCSTEPNGSFIVFRNTTASANITEISFPGFTWTGSLTNGQYLVVPLPYQTSEEVSITVNTPTGRTLTTSVIQGDGTISSIGAITLATNTADIDSTPASQYLIILS